MISQIAMASAGVCYLVAGVGFLTEGKVWSAVTVVLYSLTAVTLWLAGRS